MVYSNEISELSTSMHHFTNVIKISTMKPFHKLCVPDHFYEMTLLIYSYITVISIQVRLLYVAQ